MNIGGDNVPRVILDLSFIKNIGLDTLEDCGYSYLNETDKWLIKDLAADYIHIGNNNFAEIYSDEGLKTYDRVSFFIKPDDNKYIIYGIFGDLDFTSSDPVEITLTMRYDYAILEF